MSKYQRQTTAISVTGGQFSPIQPESVRFAIRLEIGSLPALPLFGALGFALFYPISRDVHTSILLMLQKRQVGRSANTSSASEE
ncbi:hypothetical protein IQ268_05660 [Oculatella sp. LEGE 06141]|uniref:hypothetical protein n=1 Tax=Oculatella sp. LEGE 06141 TaxID=1828648 RepID=UPI00187FCDF9|nr:hypothetical protein [Oculatella sp. LEGE 06141]MBE9178071.1 hypothetical protein [Oculatella sp. LEGE 06141]